MMTPSYKRGDRVQVIPEGYVGIVVEACRFGFSYKIRPLRGPGGVEDLPPTRIAGRVVNGRLVKPK